MEHLHFLTDLLIVFIVSGVVVYLFHRMQLPAVVGLLMAGMVVGPFGLRLIEEEENVETLAEIGVVVLLFTVGLEFSLSRLWRMGQTMLTVGLPQVLITGSVVALATSWYFAVPGKAIFAGMLVAMSSTAVVLKLLTERGELSSPHGRIAVAVLLLQDLLVVVFMISLPLIGGGDLGWSAIALQLFQGVAVLVGILLVGRYLLPQVLYNIVRTRNRELFLSAVVVLCLGTAWLTAWAGLALALGAFLAGLALSDSEYAQQALAEVVPFRDTLSSLFFVSVGMLVDLRFVALHVPLVLLTVVAIVLLKVLSVAIPTWLSGYPLRNAVMAGMTLLQVGEFSFVLASRGMSEYQLLSPDDYQTFLAAAVITMTLTPWALQYSGRIASWFPDWSGWRSEDLEVPSDLDEGDGHAPAAGHVIIAGYGINGRNVAHVLRDIDVPFVVIELNPVTVRHLRRQGEPIFYGDCSRAPVLEHLGVAQARLMVIAISDPEISRRSVKIARQLNPNLHIIVRTRYVAEVEELRRLGADEIIPEEFETSVEIFARVLHHYQVPRNVVLDLIERIRRDHYEVLRETDSPVQLELPVNLLDELQVESCLLRDDSPAVGKDLRELDLRNVAGTTVIAVQRGQQRIVNPPPTTRLEAGDIVFVIGDGPELQRSLVLLAPEIENLDAPPSD